MGAAVGARLRDKGLRVLWAGEGRSAATRKRAAQAGLEDAGTLAGALAQSSIALSVCPPHAALALAREAARAGFRGAYVDANAIAPGTAREAARIVEAAGARFTDGGIIGPPPQGSARTRLFLSGSEARRLAELLSAAPLQAVAIDGPVGAASALKVCYAAWNKNTQLLAGCIRALAAHEGVEAALLAEWRAAQPDALERVERFRASARKAWRWTGEMEESAATFAAAGLPDGFSRAGAETCQRLEAFKDVSPAPPLEQLLGALEGAAR
jgi:3-hydroxyisobutyrate dehydrogenase-like beta-hydroxyacid dehydrogenase